MAKVYFYYSAMNAGKSTNLLQSAYNYYAKNEKSSVANLACVLVDEAQFLTREQVRQLTDISDVLEMPVLAYGLRTDFLGQLFEGSKYLLAWADELKELKTVCFCGKKAIMNMRQDANGNAVTKGDQVEIGAEDKYTSLCRVHFKEKVTRNV
ncbi:MAG: thymidine kinase [Holosporales bacterium]|jgi:thymidine kinase|nr:thymidine kinase [Holosporales bacterium]